MASIASAPRYRRRLGCVTTWKQDKGFGFIRPEDGTDDAFLHITDVVNAAADGVAEGASVEFDVVVDGKGRPKAIAAVILD